MLETRVIYITLPEGEANDGKLAVALNKELSQITRKGGKLRGYVLLSDYTNTVKSRFVRFLATFSDLDSDVGLSGKLSPTELELLSIRIRPQQIPNVI